jgi:hypothetical protein
MPDFLDNDDFFTFYPRSFPDLLEKVMWFGGEPKERLGRTLWNELRNSGMLSFKRLKDLFGIKNI